LKPPSDDYAACLQNIRGRFADSGGHRVAAYLYGVFFLLVPPGILLYALFERSAPAWPFSRDEWACIILVPASLSFGIFLLLFADADYKLFLEMLERTCRRTAWEIHAYCLMSNHFHLVVKTPRSNLGTGMQWLLGSYTQRLNRRHHFSGHLFGGRYKALLVDGRSGPCLRVV
jgi:hypothetical protein